VVGGADETVDADVVTFEQLRKAIERFGAIQLDEPVPALKRLEEGHLDLVELRTSAADAARPVDESNAAQACRRPLRDGNNRRRGHLGRKTEDASRIPAGSTDGFAVADDLANSSNGQRYGHSETRLPAAPIDPVLDALEFAGLDQAP
jgi:hypothetical protein